MTWLLALLPFAPPPLDPLAEADQLAARAVAAEGEARAALVQKALDAYAALIKEDPKNRKLVPRVRRRRASLLKREKRLAEAVAEHDAIYYGRARRKDKARALYDGAVLLERQGDLEAAARRFVRACEEYPDVTNVRAKASLARGRVLQKLGKPREAEQAYRYVVERCWEEAKVAVEAYDRLALLALAEKRPERARRWLKECVKRYERRAARGDRYGAFLSRLLGDMRAPRKLTEALGER